MHSMKAKSLSRQRGITLIESLVAIVISALGILGILVSRGVSFAERKFLFWIPR